MDTLEFSVLTVICINLMLILGQFSAVHVNPNFNGSLVNCGTSPLGQFGNCTGNSYDFNTGNPQLPTTSASVDASTGSVFTDLWNTVKGWFSDTLGLKYVTAVVSAPSSFLKGMGIDSDFSNLVGGVWWVFTVLLIVTYLKR